MKGNAKSKELKVVKASQQAEEDVTVQLFDTEVSIISAAFKTE